MNASTTLMARAECLMFLSNGLAVDMCDPQSYVDEDCPDVRQVELLPDDLVLESGVCRVVALRMLRYAHASGFAKVHALTLLFATNQTHAALTLADEMFAMVGAEEMLAYAKQCHNADLISAQQPTQGAHS